MTHKMSLNERPFQLIKEGRKTIEIRCNDEKRQKISVGDSIIFQKLPEMSENITVEVLALYPYNTFEELYRAFDFSEFGCKGYTMQQLLDGTREIYSEEKHARYGALGIRVSFPLFPHCSSGCDWKE